MLRFPKLWDKREKFLYLKKQKNPTVYLKLKVKKHTSQKKILQNQ